LKVLRRRTLPGERATLAPSGTSRCRRTSIQRRFQFRADFINAFNHTQWTATPTADGIDNTCTVSVTACNVTGDRFGQILSTRNPREIQLGLKVYW
jgi:hypothetical protein